MYKLVGLIMVTVIAWSAVGCGGPGKPVNRAAELRQRSGGGAADDSGNQGSGQQDQGKNDDAGKSEEGKSADGDAKPPEPSDSDGSGEESKVDDEKAKAEKDAKAAADAKAKTAADARTRLRPGRPPGLGIASGGGRTGGGKEDDINKDKKEKNNEPPVEATGETPPASVLNETPAEKHRFTFFERANYAFSTENETEGFQYLYAHAIAEDNALVEHPIAWYTGVGEPRLGLRWGVGVDYRSGNFDGDPPKFDADSGSTSTAAGSGGSSNNSGEIGGRDISDRLPGGRRLPAAPSNNQGAAGNAPSGDDPTEQLNYYTGDFGELLLQRIELRRTNPDFFWGKALFEIDATKVFEEKQPPSGVVGGRDKSKGGQRGAGGSGLQMEDELSSGEMPASGDNSSPDSDNRRLPAVEIPGFEPEFKADPTSLVPGAIALGLGNKNELLERARAHGLDLIAVFDVSIQFSSKDEAKNSTMLTVINVKTGENVAETRKLNTVAYSKALETGKENPIEVELDKVFPEATDKSFKCSAFPNISSDKAAERVENLLNSKPGNPLPVLAEIRHYLDNDLISKTDYVAAAEALIGVENARKLVDGDIHEREEALHDWLPGQYSVSTSSSTGFR